MAVSNLRRRAARFGWAGGIERMLVQGRAQVARTGPVTSTWLG
jgi:hypothetical protein